MEEEKDATIFTVLLQVLSEYRAAAWIFALKVLHSSERLLYCFFFSHVVATHLQFLFFSAAQGLIRLIVLLVSKAEEDLDLTYVSEICSTAVCH